MKLFNIAVLGLTMLFVDYVSAQNISYEYGESFEIPKKITNEYTLNSPKDGFKIVTYSKKKKNFVIQSFSPDLKFLSEKEESAGDMPKYHVSEYFVTSNNQYFWIYSNWNRKERLEELYIRPFDFKNGTFIGEPRQVISSETKLVGWDLYNKYQFYRSSDSSKMMIKYKHVPKERNDKINYDELGFNVYDNSFKPLWSSIFQMPYTEELMDVIDLQLTNKGDVLMLAKVFEGKRRETKKGEEDPNYTYQLLLFSKNNKTPKVIIINTGTNFIQSSYIYEDKNGSIFFMGYYGKTKDAGVDGIFTMKMKDFSSGKFSSSQFTEFSNEMLLAFSKKDRSMEKAQREGKDLSINNLTVGDVIPLPGGGYYIIGEVYYVVSHTHYSSNGGSYTTYSYFYEDLYISKIDATGKILYATKIPKRQSGGRSPGGLSYNYLVKDNNLYLFYVENEKNLNLDVTEKPAYHQDGLGGQLFCSTVDAKGNTTRKLIFDVKEEG
ncbi:MAG: hypothetical protein K2Q22_16460, partial [Cytophagales bacterium]|nr:hypothetical protein [Cytophagales bacterium]